MTTFAAKQAFDLPNNRCLGEKIVGVLDARAALEEAFQEITKDGGEWHPEEVLEQGVTTAHDEPSPEDGRDEAANEADGGAFPSFVG